MSNAAEWLRALTEDPEAEPEAPLELPAGEADPEIPETEPSAPADDVLALSEWGDTLSHPEIEALIRKAKNATLPASRPLKSWEPQKLNDRHLVVIFLRAAGLRQNRIAEITNFTQARVSVIVNHPYAKIILTKLLSIAAEQAVDMKGRIKASAPEMFEVVKGIALDETQKPTLRSRNAFKILEMAGAGETQETKHVHEFKMPAERADQLSQAIRESRNIEEASYVDITEGSPDDAEGSADTDDGDSGEADEGRPADTQSSSQPRYGSATHKGGPAALPSGGEPPPLAGSQPEDQEWQ